ncbi:MAG: type II toxin-antitoxin system RelE/ParE family toxin [Flavobacteriales bacterium]|nr:type II toxin-antitoxin system RelE/ParE family toxin [Flavobacteriales bacterium]
MSHPVALSPRAKDDLNQAAMWYRSRRTGLDSEFMNEIGDHLNTIASFPTGAPRIGRTIRMLPLSKFPYVITYRFSSGTVYIIRVVHSRRHPLVRSR